VAITLVAAVTAHASDRTPEPRPDTRDVVYVETPEQVPPTEDHPAPVHVEAPSEPKIPELPYTTVEVPTTIPTGIPPVNLALPPVDPDQFAISLAPSNAGRDAGNVASRGGSGTFSAWEVEKAVVPLSGNPKPEYPSMLQSGHVEGEVLAQFVVDTTGRVDMSTFRALRATDELFVQSVRRALAHWKFLPAEAGGVKVRQLVQMPLSFKVRGE
jgi:protein TonB